MDFHLALGLYNEIIITLEQLPKYFELPFRLSFETTC